MKLRLVLLLSVLVLSSLALSAGGIAITEKTKIVILPGKVGVGWNMDAIDTLLGILEEQALQLGRFQVFPRSDLQAIMRERNLSEFGVSEAIQVGKLGGSKFAILLSLEELSSSWNSRANQYDAVSRYTIRLYNVENGELLASKSLTSSGSSKETAQKAITSALRSTAGDIWMFLRETFKLEAYVKSIQGDQVILAGVDPKLAKPGYIFQVETDTGIGYVKVTGYNRAEGTVVAKFMYGERPNAYDVAQEYPTFPAHGGIGVSVFIAASTPLFGLGLSAWTDGTGDIPLPVYVGLGTFLGSYRGDTPVYMNLGANLRLVEFGRLGVSANGGLSILGLVDLDTFNFTDYIFGIFAGGVVTYEFNPTFGVYGSVGYTLYFGDLNGLAIQVGAYF